ncbi:tetratricopeptide repeat protein [Methylobacterium gnaphalii]|nr:tetratricopeptide repeat protein [Methylobacterium gnaphalii]GJD69774.1 Beta-barrel assembly-enhancing protease [Methylobacterium gnaphalii]
MRAAPLIPHAFSSFGKAGRSLGAAALVAALAAGCQSRSPETTGSIGAVSTPRTASRGEVDNLGAKYSADPADVGVAMRYASALRATNQRTQAVAVLQQTALRNPKNRAVLAAYGKSLADAGRFAEAAEVLQNAHTPAQPDWRVLSAQGTVADQLGDHVRAQGFYEAALKIVPNEPTVLSNLGLSYLLGRQLDQAETTLRLAADQPHADARVRQNLALALGLRGRFDEAETVLRRDLTPEAAAANIVSLRAVVARQSSEKAAKTVSRELPRAVIAAPRT